MANLADSWGYERITTPLAEPEDAFGAVAAEDLEHRAYRMIDASGRTMLLRSDVTLFAARQLAAIPTHTAEQPTRAWYAEPILRRADPESLAGDEAYQLGVELIGDPRLDADLEVILLAAEYLAALGIGDAVIHLGSAGLIADVPAGLREPLRLAVLRRDWQGVAAVLRGHHAQGAPSERFGTIAEGAAASDWIASWRKVAPEPLQEPLSDLARALAVCRELSPIPVRLDCSELGSRSYHSGISFRIYGPDNPRAIGGGGRYNGLLGLFGSERVATGWSVTAGQLLRAGAPGTLATPGTDTAQGEDFPTRYRNAQSLRSQGRRVRL